MKKEEAKIRAKILRELHRFGWFAKVTNGNKFQSGAPDIYACHKRHGPRWIEVKKPKGSRLEGTQSYVFSEWESRGVGIWILTDSNLAPLFNAPNWRTFAEGKTPTDVEWVERIGSRGAERDLQEAVKRKLRRDGWFCLDFYGHTFSYGFPDFYACHREHGERWVEMKCRRVFTPSQKKTFQLMTDAGAGIWVLESDSVVPLFEPSNLGQFNLTIDDPLDFFK